MAQEAKKLRLSDRLISPPAIEILHHRRHLPIFSRC
jgi:hypothetical protein